MRYADAPVSQDCNVSGMTADPSRCFWSLLATGTTTAVLDFAISLMRLAMGDSPIEHMSTR